MPYDIYLELKQEDIVILTGPREDLEEGEDFDNEEAKAEMPVETEDGLEATPVYFYRNPINGGMHLELDFDPAPHNVLHVVFIRYYETMQDGTDIPRWDVIKVTHSRRIAKDILENIEEGRFEDVPDGRWKRDNVMIDEIEVYSLGVEE